MNSLNEGIEMNHISLKKVTVIVSTCILASYFVSADEKVENIAVAQTEAISATVKATNSFATAITDIPALLTKFDSNNNGQLNLAEVTVSNNEVLAKHFKDIDQNADAELSANELKHFFVEIQSLKDSASK